MRIGIIKFNLLREWCSFNCFSNHATKQLLPTLSSRFEMLKANQSAEEIIKEIIDKVEEQVRKSNNLWYTVE